VAGEVGDLMASLILTLAPHRIVVGGGVGQGQAELLPLVHEAAARLLGGYLPGHSLEALQRVIVHPGLGGDAGVWRRAPGTRRWLCSGIRVGPADGQACLTMRGRCHLSINCHKCL